MKITIAFLAVLLMAAFVLGADDGRVQRYPDGLRIGSDGSKLSLLYAGQIDIANGATTATQTVASAAVGDLVFLSPAESLGSATKFFGEATTNTVGVTVDQDPQTTITLNVLLIGKD